MAKKDWVEVLKIFEKKEKNYIKEFLNSDQIFCPNDIQKNIFGTSNDFSSKDIGKNLPANWIPNYTSNTLSNYLNSNKLMPIRSGKGSFFFYKGKIFLDLEKITYKKVNIKNIFTPYNFIPLTLNVNFQKNENAYINKAISLGIINHFINSKEVLIHGQSGTIKLSNALSFKTSKATKTINNGFQFEVDMVLETKDEIIIIEAKNPSQDFTKEFSLLQLYYPLIYFNKTINYKKKIRTIFIDILANNEKEEYKLIEIEFVNELFNELKILESLIYKF